MPEIFNENKFNILSDIYIFNSVGGIGLIIKIRKISKTPWQDFEKILTEISRADCRKEK
jgi:hypothetical protein